MICPRLRHGVNLFEIAPEPHRQSHILLLALVLRRRLDLPLVLLS
jgi:hypothetical protein